MSKKRAYGKWNGQQNETGLVYNAMKPYTIQGVGRHVRAQLVHRSQVWPLAGGWLEDHEVEGAPRVVKDIATTLSEQSENTSVLQRTVVADAHGGIFSKRFSGGGSFVMLRGGVPVCRERSELSHFRVIEVLVDVVAVLWPSAPSSSPPSSSLPSSSLPPSSLPPSSLPPSSSSPSACTCSMILHS